MHFLSSNFFFGDYIEELYKKFNLDMNDDESHGNYITSGFEESTKICLDLNT